MVDYVIGMYGLYDTGECKPNPYLGGYGRKIPTPYKLVQTFDDCRGLAKGRLYNVYAMCYSNASSLYILVQGKELFIR